MVARLILGDSGGTARQTKRLIIGDSGGTARVIKRLFIGDSGGVARLIHQGFTVTASPVAWQLSESGADGDPISSIYQLESDGTVTTFGGVVVAGSTSWGSPTTAGVGAAYWAKFTATSGSFDGNEASTWTQINTSLSCYLTGSFGSLSTTFKVEIATDSGGSNIVFTSAGNVMSLTHS